MKRALCLSVFALLVSIIAYAQTFSLKGEVTDKNRQAISYASIALLKTGQHNPCGRYDKR